MPAIPGECRAAPGRCKGLSTIQPKRCPSDGGWAIAERLDLWGKSSGTTTRKRGIMRFFKALCLAALTALLAMAIMSASSAMAEFTELCSVDEEPCTSEHAVTHVHETT